MIHQFSMLHSIYLDDSFISSDAYLKHSNNCNDCRYHRSDAIFRGRNWRESRIPSLLSTSFKESKGALVLGHSDQKTGIGRVLMLRFLGFRYIYGINVIRFKPLSTPIPIGVTNKTNESEYHRLFGDNELLMKADKSDFLSKSNGLVYGCFSTNTNPKERLPLAELLSQSKHTFEEPEFSIEGRICYLENLRKYAFTACPVGNGVDTHRLWEVLYMGGIPIIKQNRILESLLEDLPYVLVQDWKQINDDGFLQDSWDRLSQHQNYNFEKLKLQYWINLIHSR